MSPVYWIKNLEMNSFIFSRVPKYIECYNFTDVQLIENVIKMTWTFGNFKLQLPYRVSQFIPCHIVIAQPGDLMNTPVTSNHTDVILLKGL